MHILLLLAKALSNEQMPDITPFPHREYPKFPSNIVTETSLIQTTAFIVCLSIFAVAIIGIIIWFKIKKTIKSIKYIDYIIKPDIAKMRSNPILFYSFIAISLLIFVGSDLVSTGKIFYGMYPSAPVNGTAANEHWKYFVKDVRIIGHKHYNDSVDYIVNYIESFKGTAKQKFTYQKEIIPFTNKNYYLPNMMTVSAMVPARKVTEETLYLSAHLDSHPVGPGGYDYVCGIAAMLELLRAVSEGDVGFDFNIGFNFLGGEEHALEGSIDYCQMYNAHGHILNLEGYGTSRPLMMTTKGRLSSSIIKAWASTPGAISMTSANDMMKSGAVGSSSDLVIYSKHNLTGAEIVFTGDHGHYHTRYDTIVNENDVVYEANLLYGFLKKFKPEYSQSDYTSIGMGPL